MIKRKWEDLKRRFGVTGGISLLLGQGKMFFLYVAMVVYFAVITVLTTTGIARGIWKAVLVLPALVLIIVLLFKRRDSMIGDVPPQAYAGRDEGTGESRDTEGPEETDTGAGL